MARRRTGAQLAASRKNIAIARKARSYSNSSAQAAQSFRSAAIGAATQATARVTRLPRGVATRTVLSLPKLPNLSLPASGKVMTLPRPPASKPKGPKAKTISQPVAGRNPGSSRTTAVITNPAKAALTPQFRF